MTIYLDIVFLENILMNFIIIFATGVVIKCNCSKCRYFIASIIGATYTVVMYLNIIPLSYFDGNSAFFIHLQVFSNNTILL